MCSGQQPPFPKEDVKGRSASAVVEDLRDRLAETEVRLARARAREAALSRRLHQMKRFVSVMEILEDYLKRRYNLQQRHVASLFSPPSTLSNNP
ncbi:hypothetical protein RJT34_02116 [Clitoria ternatea]|uniref:Protein SKIP34 n=1 Tax=Clitoria ternatea TaxID=43366 RepID=A0AAN9KIA9_CLITE